MTTTPQLMTEDDLLRLPPDNMRHELVKGELRTMAPAGSEHGGFGMNLGGPLAVYVKQNHLGVVLLAETGFTIEKNPDTVRAPDVGFVSQNRIPPGGLPKKFFPGAPDLAVEVVSPSDTVYEVDEKVQAWLAAGTQLVWVVNPKRQTVTVNRGSQPPRILPATETLSGEDVVPGFSLPIREIFS